MENFTFAPFNLKFNKIGVFAKAGILWLGSKDRTEALLKAHEELKLNLSNCNITFESRKFRPHITLARKFSSRTLTQKFEPINLKVKQINLMHSVTIPGGVNYETLLKLPLSHK